MIDKEKMRRPYVIVAAELLRCEKNMCLDPWQIASQAAMEKVKGWACETERYT
jgi:hypothetical protein